MTVVDRNRISAVVIPKSGSSIFEPYVYTLDCGAVFLFRYTLDCGAALMMFSDLFVCGFINNVDGGAESMMV